MIELLALILLQQGGSADTMTQSALKNTLQHTRASAGLYEAAAKKHGKSFPFVTFAHTERRHEKLLLDLLKTYNITAPAPPKIAVPVTLSAVLKQGQLEEKETLIETKRALGFVKQTDIEEVLTVIQLTARDIHLPAVEKKLGPNLPHPTAKEIKRLRGR